MANTNHHYNKEKARIYREAYRRSFRISYFIRSLLSVILMGQAPMGGIRYYRIKKSAK
jgi:hypothetical protein